MNDFNPAGSLDNLYNRIKDRVTGGASATYRQEQLRPQATTTYTSALKSLIAEYGAFAGTLHNVVNKPGQPIINTHLELDENGFLAGRSELDEKSKALFAERTSSNFYHLIGYRNEYNISTVQSSVLDPRSESYLQERLGMFMNNIASVQYMLQLANSIGGDKGLEILDSVASQLNSAGHNMDAIRREIGDKFKPPIGPLENRTEYTGIE
jgi:hypothetical protein